MGVKFLMQVPPERAPRSVTAEFSESVMHALMDQYKLIRTNRTAEETDRIFTKALIKKKNKFTTTTLGSGTGTATKTVQASSGRDDIQYNPFDWAMALMKQALEVEMTTTKKQNTKQARKRDLKGKAASLSAIPEGEECTSDYSIEETFSEASDISENSLAQIKSLFKAKLNVDDEDEDTANCDADTSCIDQEDLDEIMEDTVPNHSSSPLSLFPKGLNMESGNSFDDWYESAKDSVGSTFSFIDESMALAMSASMKKNAGADHSLISTVLGGKNSPYGYTATSQSFDTRLSRKSNATSCQTSDSATARDDEEHTEDDDSSSGAKRDEPNSEQISSCASSSLDTFFLKTNTKSTSSSSSNSWLGSSISSLSGDTARHMRAKNSVLSKEADAFIDGDLTRKSKLIAANKSLERPRGSVRSSDSDPTRLLQGKLSGSGSSSTCSSSSRKSSSSVSSHKSKSSSSKGHSVARSLFVKRSESFKSQRSAPVCR
jgi:hypothetical protein